MNKFRERKSWIVLMAVLLLFAACKGETPTAPPPGGGIPPGGTPPPTGVNLTLTTSNTNPLVDSTVTITATVTQDGNPVPNGTAVEFSSNGGTLTGGTTSVLRTTSNGIATVTLTSGTPGTIRVTATVNNVTRTVDVTFVARPIVTPPPPTTATITSITPAIGRPSGGELIRITGTNFRSPVRVLFDIGLPVPVEGVVVSVSETVIEVITPPVNLGAGQQLAADVIVLTEAGSTTEQRVEVAGGFTFRNVQLTPVIHTVTPNSGPVVGGTRVTIIGEGFQEPVQVLFNTAEARVLNVTFNQILVEAPAGRDTAPNGSDVVTGPVTVRVRNINSNREAAMESGFHYKADMVITGVTLSGNGTTAGGGRVTIEGIGFVAPVIVVIADTAQGDISLNLVSVTGTRIVATIPAIIPENCNQDIEGDIVVTNINNGDQATGPRLQLATLQPAIVRVNPTAVTVGVNATFTVTVANPVPGPVRFIVGGKTVFPTNAVVNNDGTVTYTVPVPTNLTFETEACETGGTRRVPLDVDIEFSPAIEGCEDTVEDALTVNPASDECVTPPEPEAAVSFTANGVGCAQPANTAPGTPTSTLITFSNTGDAPLTITHAVSGTNAADFVVTPPNRSIAAGASDTFTVTFNPVPGPAAQRNATVTFSTNDEDEPTFPICVQGTNTTPTP
jgi:hypothetical protein